MKTKIYLLLILVLSASCSSLLEEEVYSEITSNNFFKDERDLDVALAGVYDGIQEGSMNENRLWFFEITTSDVTGGLLMSFWPRPAETMVMENMAEEPWKLWIWYFNAVGRANAFLKELGKSSINKEIKLRYQAEVRFVRAYIYFNLVRLYGHVPIVKASPNTISDVLTPDTTNVEAYESDFLKQREREDIFDFIIEDLKFAEDNLPAEVASSESGRATNGAASGLLAKVYLTMAGTQFDYNSGELNEGDFTCFSKCIQQCEKLMLTDRYKLMDDYSKIYEIPNNNEVLFSIQYLESATAGMLGEGNGIMPRMGIKGALNYTPYGGKGFYVNKMFWEDFRDHNIKDDNRYSRTFVEYYIESNGDTIWQGTTNNFLAPHIRKYLTDLGPNPNAQNGQDFGADWIVLRFADILLMHSEAMNEIGQNPDEETIQGINLVRERAGQPLIQIGITKEELRELIWQERKWELCFEGHHYFDCMRTGRLLEEFEKYFHNNRNSHATIRNYLFPIPYKATLSNPSLKQNFGW